MLTNPMSQPFQGLSKRGGVVGFHSSRGTGFSAPSPKARFTSCHAYVILYHIFPALLASTELFWMIRSLLTASAA